VGVLTKPDQVEEACHAPWLAVLRGERYPLRLGYFLVKSPNQAQLLQVRGGARAGPLGWSAAQWQRAVAAQGSGSAAQWQRCAVAEQGRASAAPAGALPGAASMKPPLPCPSPGHHV
jgi:hypothetical protein